MLKRLLLITLLPATVMAECVLTDRTSVGSTAQILERSGITQDIVPAPMLPGYHRCQVMFKARIGAEWYLASGYHDWPGDRPAAEACSIARNRADDSARAQAGTSLVQSDKTMVCTDRTDLKTFQNVLVGTQGQLHQFRPHPDQTRDFYHNGTRCRWFTEPSFTGRDISNLQGVICQLSKTQWIVVDKF